jgi:hypothetical protein
MGLPVGRATTIHRTLIASNPNHNIMKAKGARKKSGGMVGPNGRKNVQGCVSLKTEIRNTTSSNINGAKALYSTASNNP